MAQRPRLGHHFIRDLDPYGPKIEHVYVVYLYIYRVEPSARVWGIISYLTSTPMVQKYGMDRIRMHTSGVRVITQTRSWPQDTLKRKLVDFAWNRQFFYLPGACSPFFG